VQILRLVAGTLLNTASFAVPLFLPAGTLGWWRAWVVTGVVFAGTIWAIVGLARTGSGLLEERMKPPVQEGQPLGDRVLVLLLLLTFVGLLVFTSLDVFRFHLLPKPWQALTFLGLGLFIAGWTLAYLALRENAYGAAVVRHQQERGQRVVDTGLYAIVRHPMYAGGAVLMLGIPLWLQSTAGVLFALLPIAVLIARIILEERFLVRALPGYDRYAQRVRYRLLPRVW
jgi:protein-S-isoprenylcysteine O-methyltransferase Ste14